MSVRDSLNQKPVTQEDVERYVADEPDRLPYGGAGSMAGHARRASKQYRPADARARLTAAERAQFAAENAEVEQLSPEDEARIHAEVDKRLKSVEFKEYFADKVRRNLPLEDAWKRSKIEGDCPFFRSIERDGDPAGAPQEQIIAAWKAFAESPIFVAYYTTEKDSPRGKVLRKTMDLLYAFMCVNLVNLTLPGSWAACFGLLQNIDVLPAPVTTDEQVKAADRNRPADDGNPVAMNDVTGQPVTYKFKDGRVVRYSKQMLDQSNSESYAKLLGIRKSPGELQETEEQRRARKALEYRTKIVAGGYTQKELDAMPSEKYREVMQLSRAPMAMKPFDRL
jgi:hypothetical protein